MPALYNFIYSIRQRFLLSENIGIPVHIQQCKPLLMKRLKRSGNQDPLINSGEAWLPSIKRAHVWTPPEETCLEFILALSYCLPQDLMCLLYTMHVGGTNINSFTNSIHHIINMWEDQDSIEINIRHDCVYKISHTKIMAMWSQLSLLAIFRITLLSILSPCR